MTWNFRTRTSTYGRSPLVYGRMLPYWYSWDPEEKGKLVKNDEFKGHCLVCNGPGSRVRGWDGGLPAPACLRVAHAVGTFRSYGVVATLADLEGSCRSAQYHSSVGTLGNCRRKGTPLGCCHASWVGNLPTPGRQLLEAARGKGFAVIAQAQQLHAACTTCTSNMHCAKARQLGKPSRRCWFAVCVVSRLVDGPSRGAQAHPLYQTIAENNALFTVVG